jgi:hypothetical protein
MFAVERSSTRTDLVEIINKESIINVLFYQLINSFMRRSDSPLYKRWYQIATGCSDPNSAPWKVYGAQGVTCVKSWIPYKVGFDNFEHWVLSTLGPQPNPDSILRRINTKKGWHPGNIEWSTRLIQSNNRSTNMMIQVGKRKQSLADWCRETGLLEATVWSRLKRGHKPKEALEL